MNQSVIDRIEIEMRQKRIMELREKVISQQPPHIRAKYQTDHSSQQPLSVSQRDDGQLLAEPPCQGTGTNIQDGMTERKPKTRKADTLKGFFPSKRTNVELFFFTTQNVGNTPIPDIISKVTKETGHPLIIFAEDGQKPGKPEAKEPLPELSVRAEPTSYNLQQPKQSITCLILPLEPPPKQPSWTLPPYTWHIPSATPLTTEFPRLT